LGRRSRPGSMVKKSYFIPGRGDAVWINFNPQKGREQANKRPAIVISPKIYNQKTGLAIMCPITSQIKNYPFEILIDENKIKGAVLSDQLRCLDWRARKISFIQKIKPEAISAIQQKIALLLLK